MFQDDQYLIYQPRDTVVGALDTLKSLGVDRVKVQVLWARRAEPGLADDAGTGSTPPIRRTT